MFAKYNYLIRGEDVIVYSIEDMGQGQLISLYRNDKLIDSEVASLGEYLLGDATHELSIKRSALKSKHEFKIDGEVAELEAIKLKPLREILTRYGVNNKFNPTKEEQELLKFKPKVLLKPILLILLSFVLLYVLRGKAFPSDILSILPAAIAGWMLFDIASERAMWLRDMRKARLVFVFVTAIGTGFLADYIYSLILP